MLIGSSDALALAEYAEKHSPLVVIAASALEAQRLVEETALFPIIVANASMNSWTGLIKMVGYIAAFTIILQTVVNMSFQLIRFVPDQVLGWIGGNQVNNIGANAAGEVGGAARNAMAGVGWSVGRLQAESKPNRPRRVSTSRTRSIIR